MNQPNLLSGKGFAQPTGDIIFAKIGRGVTNTAVPNYDGNLTKGRNHGSASG